MGIFGKLIGGQATDLVKGVGGILDDLITTEDEKLTHAEIMERLKQRPELAQIHLNQQEAAHRTIFVAGWRPFIGWVCGVALAYHYIGEPFMAWGFAAWMPDMTPPPKLAVGDLIAIVSAMLGFGGLRTFEKSNGVAR
ncbi:MAG: 3TM-type holin [Robiginitomaculum sp.]|nr:3TM-type holin [Robiginitomaculum sp.]